jgi:phospholipid/cholesterol/gamma-HCH transport system ATP-binding protein
VHGARVDNMSENEMMKVRDHLGMVFQEGALFDSLTVAENVGYKLYEETDMPLDEVRRRVAIARAMSYKPPTLLYDEATTGLDPITATTVDEEIIKLRDLENVSSIVVTHQLRDAFLVATHEAVREGEKIEIVSADPKKCDEAEFIMLKDGGVLFEGNAAELRASTDPYIRTFLS